MERKQSIPGQVNNITAGIKWSNKNKNKKKTWHEAFRDTQISPILLYVRLKSWVTFVRRCFRDVNLMTNVGARKP